MIRGFTAVIDPGAMQWTTEAYVQVFCRGNISPDDLRAAWEPIPEIVSAAAVTGSADAIPAGRGRDVGHLEQALERIRRAGAVDRSESIIILSRLIDRAHPDPGGNACATVIGVNTRVRAYWRFIETPGGATVKR